MYVNAFYRIRYQWRSEQLPLNVRQLSFLQKIQVCLASRIGIRIAEGKLVDVVLAVESEGEAQDVMVLMIRWVIVEHLLVRNPLPGTKPHKEIYLVTFPIDGNYEIHSSIIRKLLIEKLKRKEWSKSSEDCNTFLTLSLHFTSDVRKLFIFNLIFIFYYSYFFVLENIILQPRFVITF